MSKLKINKSTLFFAVTLCIILSLISREVCSSRESELSSSRTTNHSYRVRKGFSLPKIFEFEYYKALFKKHYKSLVEHVVRQRLYLGRAFRAFISAVTYKHRKSSIYLAINQMSDWTLKELEMIQMRREDALEEEDLKVSLSREKPRLGEFNNKLDGSENNSMIPAANLDDIRKKFVEISLDQNRMTKPGYQEIYQELRKAHYDSLLRIKRSSLANRQKLRKLNLDDLIHEPQDDTTNEISAIVPSNNPFYEPVELHSFGSDKQAANDDEVMMMLVEDANSANNLPGIEFINNLVRATSNLFNSIQENPIFKEFNKNLNGNNEESATEEDEGDLKLEEEEDVKLEEEVLDDEVYIDHRESNCFFEPRDQGKCGSCYIFAPIALYEWFYCMATGTKVAFSEQYPLDCGQSKVGFKGCKGGRFNRLSPFVQLYGIELRKNYPYRQKNDTCPYDEQSTPPTSMGYLKIFDRGFKHYLIDDVEDQLKSSPMVVNMKLHSKFAEYGGGVDDGFDCESTTGLHSVVIIGSGREEGQEYWLIRNSYSVAWGESGHFRLSKKTNCLDLNKAFTLDSVRILAKHTNPKYTGTVPLRRRYVEYMKQDLQSLSKKVAEPGQETTSDPKNS